VRGAVALLAAAAMLVAACGEDDAPRSSTTTTTPTMTTTAGAIKLEISHDDGAGRASSGGLICESGDQRATGELAGRRTAAELCRDARALASLLTGGRGRQACTQIYGGPQTVQITGAIDGRRINRRFSRTNGCRIEEYTRLKPILPPNR